MDDAFPLPELPPKGVIHVWVVELDRPSNASVDLDRILSVDERERAGRFAFAKDASRFRHCRAMLRFGLAWYLQKAPTEIRLTTGWRGKPRLAEDLELFFNVAHSGSLGLLAFATVGEVGIDIESVHREVEAVEIAKAHFTPGESAMIAAGSTPEEQNSVFLRLWTRKEAVLKATGSGIAAGLDTVDVSRGNGGVVRVGNAQNGVTESRWLVEDIDPIEPMNGFIGAVAAPSGDWRVMQWPICCDEVIHRLGLSSAG